MSLSFSRALRFDVIKPFPTNDLNRRLNKRRIIRVEGILRELVDANSLGLRNRLPKPDRLRYLRDGTPRPELPPRIKRADEAKLKRRLAK
jgi:hypothetical protein